MDGWMDGWVNGWINGWMDDRWMGYYGWMDRYIGVKSMYERMYEWCHIYV